ncbi:hypothetical protein [Rhodococcus jostii]|uniref:hypothetical protein n=1 Tax=Rhodococcus jostii TaxID=132919 RepID=UPI00362A82A4
MVVLLRMVVTVVRDRHGGTQVCASPMEAAQSAVDLRQTRRRDHARGEAMTDLSWMTRWQIIRWAAAGLYRMYH